jgi:PAS domain-containing protein
MPVTKIPTMSLDDLLRELAATNQELRWEIIERKRAEDDLRQQHEILQIIFDHIPIMIRFLGADGRIQLVNRAWERTLG